MPRTAQPRSSHASTNGTAVVQVGGLRDAAGLQGRAERRGHPDHVVVVRPAGAHHGPGVVVEEREKVRLLPADHRAVESVPRPHLVRPGALEPSEGPLLLLRPRGRPVQLQPLEQPLQGPVRRRPPRRDLQDPPDLRRGPPRLLPLQRLRQRQHLLRGPRRGLPRATAPARRTRPPRTRRRQRVSVEYDTVTRRPPGPSWTRPASSLARQPRSARLSPGSRSSCTSEYRNRPVSRARSTRAFLIRLVRSRHILSLLGACPSQARRE